MNLSKQQFKVFIFLIVMALNSSLNLSAQEINAKVKIDYRAIQGTNTSVFQTLETSLNEFVNNQRWSNDTYDQDERIECNFFLTLLSNEGNSYTASLAVTARRPIYNASISTTLINLVDNDLTFTYNEFDQLIFNKNSLSQDLTAVIGFYAYTILGIDADTFSKSGGEKHFANAMDVVNSAKSSSSLNEAGWDRLASKKNRHMLISQITSPAFEPLRTYTYMYHRQGLDLLADDLEKGADNILSNLKSLERVAVTTPASYTMLLFFDAKTIEIQSLLKEMKDEDQLEVKKQAVATLKKLDPSRVKAYNKLLQ